MKYSEEYLAKLNYDIGGEQGITLEEIRRYGDYRDTERGMEMQDDPYVRKECLEVLNNMAKQDGLLT